MSANSSAPTTGSPFWRTKPISSMSRTEWESLCDGCGKCCLHKLEDEDTGRVHYTNVACRMLNTGTCRCKDYDNRKRYVPDCVQLTAAAVGELKWLPTTCAYRLLAEGKDLPWWHPLVSGDDNTVHEAGISVRARCIPENRAGPLDHHIVTWPE
ncbi:MAG: YcgN family cysteine cluster protein [Rhodospirillaceae bacterium]|nr:YcgN family cysteine cluster protein [Rhodospirillales bacterium]